MLRDHLVIAMPAISATCGTDNLLSRALPADCAEVNLCQKNHSLRLWFFCHLSLRIRADVLSTKAYEAFRSKAIASSQSLLQLKSVSKKMLLVPGGSSSGFSITSSQFLT